MDKAIPQPVVRPKPQPRKSSSSTATNSPSSTRALSQDLTSLSDNFEDPVLSNSKEGDNVPPVLPPRTSATNKAANLPHPGVRLRHRIMEDYREFAIKKGFSDEVFEMAVVALGKKLEDVNTNELFAQLVSVQGLQSSLSSDNTAPKLPPRTHQTRPLKPTKSNSELRPIAIDGSNVAMLHGRGQVFSCKGIQQAVDWFTNEGHTAIKVFIPEDRLDHTYTNIQDQHILESLNDEGILVTTPVRRTENGKIYCYDDRFILKYASDEKAVVVSNDQYRDLINESADFRETVAKRLLMFTFIDDKFMPAEDPLGKRGMTLSQLLRRVSSASADGKTCPYGWKCTYGMKCKYSHPERVAKTAVVGPMIAAPSPSSSIYHSMSDSSLQSSQYYSLNGPPSYYMDYSNHPSHHTSSQQQILISRGGGDSDSYDMYPSAAPNSEPSLPPKPIDPNRGAYVPLINPQPTPAPHSQYLVRGSVQQSSPSHHQMYNSSNHDPAVSAADDFHKQRQLIFNSLKNLFPEHTVKYVMSQYPAETNPAIICQALALEHKM